MGYRIIPWVPGEPVEFWADCLVPPGTGRTLTLLSQRLVAAKAILRTRAVYDGAGWVAETMTTLRDQCLTRGTTLTCAEIEAAWVTWCKDRKRPSPWGATSAPTGGETISVRMPSAARWVSSEALTVAAIRVRNMLRGVGAAFTEIADHLLGVSFVRGMKLLETEVVNLERRAGIA